MARELGAKNWARLGVLLGAVLVALVGAIGAEVARAQSGVMAEHSSLVERLAPRLDLRLMDEVDLTAHLGQITKRTYALAVEGRRGVGWSPSPSCERMDDTFLRAVDVPQRRRPVDNARISFELPMECWYRVELTNRGWRYGLWRVQSEAGRIEGVSFHLLRPSKERLPERLALFTPTIDLGAGESATLYVMSIGEAPALRLTPIDATAHKAMAFSAWRVGHVAAAAAMLAFFISFAFALRSRPAAWYAAFFAALIVVQVQAGAFFLTAFADDRIVSAINTEHRWAFGLHALAVAELALVLAYIGFISAFLRARTRQPPIWRAATVLAALACVATVYELQSYARVSVSDFREVDDAALALSYAMFGIFVALGAWASAAALRARRDGAWLFAFGVLALSTNLLANIVSAAFPGPWTPWVRALTPSLHLLDGAIFAAAIVRQTLALRRERDGALAAELDASRAQIEAATALLDMRKARDEAMRLAERRRERLALASHDLRQPLNALRLNLERAEMQAPELGHTLGTALDHLDGVLGGALAESRPETAPAAPTPSSTSDAEPMAAQLVLANVARLFSADAAAKGVTLRVVASSAVITAEPVALIRILSRLVSDALEGADAGRVLVGARRRGDALAFEVWDQSADRAPEPESAEMSRARRDAARLGLALEAARRPAGGGVRRLSGLALAAEPEPLEPAAVLH